MVDRVFPFMRRRDAERQQAIHELHRIGEGEFGHSGPAPTSDPVDVGCADDCVHPSHRHVPFSAQVAATVGRVLAGCGDPTHDLSGAVRSPVMTPEQLAYDGLLATAADTFDALADMMAVLARDAQRAAITHEHIANALRRAEPMARAAARNVRRAG
jgi:hypothetical protein